MNLFRYNKSSIATFILLASFIIAFTALISCSSSEKESSQKDAGKNNSLQQGAKVSTQGGKEKSSHARPKLLELGSKNCIPCRMMEPILESLKKKYGDKLEVEFIDVRKVRSAARKYRIRVIPTQIFFSHDGKELFRHRGFMPEEDIIAKWKELGYDLKKK